MRIARLHLPCCPLRRQSREPAGPTPADLRPQQDSNLRTRLRRPLLYPLSYGGWR
jgi:hypothetical protein